MMESHTTGKVKRLSIRSNSIRQMRDDVERMSSNDGVEVDKVEQNDVHGFKTGWGRS